MSQRSSSYSKRRPPPLPSMLSRDEMRELERLRQNEVVLKARVRTLEVEVDTLKQRLDSLRKAKNTTIVKREREIRISSPHLSGRAQRSSHSLTPHPQSKTSSQSATPPPSPCKHGDLTKEIESLTSQLAAEKTTYGKEVGRLNSLLLSERVVLEARVREMEEAHERVVKELKSTWDQREESRQREANSEIKVICDVSDDLLRKMERMKEENAELAKKLEEMISVNRQLRESNLLLQGRCETLLEDLSVKEARWSQREERLNAEIRKQWGERYHEWIAKAEKKMEELQQINKLLQEMLRTKHHNPDLQ